MEAEVFVILLLFIALAVLVNAVFDEDKDV